MTRREEVVRKALRDWRIKRALRHEEFTALQPDIDKGLADVAGRLTGVSPSKLPIPTGLRAAKWRELVFAHHAVDALGRHPGF
jgi:Arc/MetJ-type ribon-helix-helix transcriptional regulator